MLSCRDEQWFIGQGSSAGLFPKSRIRFLLFLLGLLCALYCSHVSIAQPARDYEIMIRVGFMLQAPNYADPIEVGRHGTFATVLAILLENAFAVGSAPACTLSAGVDFPDLQLLVIAPASAGTTVLKRCLEKIRDLLTQGSFDQRAFESAVREGARLHRPFSLEVGNLARPDGVYTRLWVLGQESLKKLYRDDQVLRPLLGVHDLLVSVDNEHGYRSFLNWFADQRRSDHFGFYPLSDRAAEQLREWDFSVSQPSTRPGLGRPTIDSSGHLYVRAPNAGGRSVVFLRCDRTRDRACDRNVIRAFCNKTLDQLLGTSSSEPANSKSLLHCRPIQVLGISGWIAIEAEDQDGLKRFCNELSLRRLHPVELDYSTIEYVVLVNTN